MKNKKISLVFGFVLCFLAVAIAFILFPFNKAVAEVIDIENKTYTVGELLDVSHAKIRQGDNEYTADRKQIVSPTGKVYESDTVLLDDYGFWKVNLSATENGETYMATQEIKVIKDLFVSTGNKAKVDYAYNEKVGSYGLQMSIPLGETVELNHIVDLRQGDIRHSFIDFSFIPTETGSPDAYTLYMKLTDIYDQNNWIIVRMKNWSDMGTWADGYIYMDAKAPNQEYTTTIRNDEDLYYAKRDRNTGHGWYTAAISMVGRDSSGVTTYDPVKFCFDCENRAMITNNPGSGSMIGYPWGNGTYMCKFDDPEYYDLNTEKLWDGFTTGEVRVSFYAADYNSSAVNLFISKIVGADLSQSIEEYGDPEIIVKYDGLEDFPFAVVGKPYKIFPTVTFDPDDGYISDESKVYFDYDGVKTEYEIKNGAFYPDKTGNYSIIYSAVDRYNHIGIKRVDVDCSRDNANYFKLSFDQSNQAVAGKKVKVIDNIKLIDYNACSSVSVSLYKGNSVYELDDSYSFVPTELGEYMVYVYAKDYVQTVKKWFPLTVVGDDKPVFIKEPVVEKYFVKNATYNLSDYYATYFANTGNVDVLCSLYYSENGGNRIKISNNSYMPTAAGQVDLIYVAEYNGVSVEKKVTIPVVDIGYGGSLDLSAMFVDTNGTTNKVLTAENCIISANSDSAFDFVNKLQAKSFSMSFNVVASANKFNRLNIYLTDSVDKNIRVKFAFEPNGDKSFMYINDDGKTSLNANFNGTSSKMFVLNYDNSDYSVMPESGVYTYVYKTVYGNRFNGFTSNFVNIEFEFEGVYGNAAIENLSLNGMTFFDVDEDMFRPQILVDKKSGDKNIDDIVVLTEAIFADVIDVNVSANMKVKMQGGSYVSDVNGVLLNGTQSPRATYSIKLSQIGSYLVEYTAIDNSGKRTQYSYGFKVVDSIAPTIKLFASENSAKVGDTVKIAKAVVRDNIDQPTLCVFVLKPDSTIQQVNAEQDFKVTQKGVYTIYYYAFDTNDNSIVVSYKITVE